MGGRDRPGFSPRYVAQPPGRFSRTPQAGEGPPQPRPAWVSQASRRQRLPPEREAGTLSCQPQGIPWQRGRKGCRRPPGSAGRGVQTLPSAPGLGWAGARGDFCGPQTDAHTRKDAPPPHTHTRPLEGTALPRGGEQVPPAEGWRQGHTQRSCAPRRPGSEAWGPGSVFWVLQPPSRAAGSGSGVSAPTWKWTHSPAGEAAGEDALCWP